MKVTKLTKQVVDALQPSDKPYVVWCGVLPGFGISVRPSGGMSFMAQYDFGGRRGVTRRVTIGRYGAGSLWTVDKARREAETILHDAKRGIDHAEAKAKKRAEHTVAELCDEYLREGCEDKKASTIKTDKGRIARHIKPLLGRMKISDVRSSHIEKFKKDVANGKTARSMTNEQGNRVVVTGGRGTATRTIRLLGGIFTYAVKCQYLAENPCRGVKTYADRKGERFLSVDEFRRLGEALVAAETTGLPWQVKDGPNAKHTPRKAETALEPVSPHVTGAIWLLLLTGCRVSEILTLQWPHVDQERGILNLPDSKTRQKKVLIGDAARHILAKLWAIRVADNPYVIVGEKPQQPRSDIKRPWARITAYAGLNQAGEDGRVVPLRMHDLRHSFASVGVEANFGLSIVGKLLGHGSAATTARYAHIAESAERRALNDIESRIATAAGLIETAEIIPINRSAASS